MSSNTSQSYGQWIEEESFRRIEAEVEEPRPFRGEQWQVVRRMIHASADFDMLSLVRFHPGAIQAGKKALSRGRRIVADTEMTRAGLTATRLKGLGCETACYLNNPEVAERARSSDRTRSHAAMEAAVRDSEEAVFVIGNAPTALEALLDCAGSDEVAPALVIGMPVGFVGASEAKERLENQDRIPFITLRGRKGGSALAASCLNALAELLLREDKD
jgi:precorrin-8X/cobalt-precorrin-8 methylmutase